MRNSIDIQSSRGLYAVHFKDAFEHLKSYPMDKTQLVIDLRVFDLYRNRFNELEGFKKVFIEATEQNKNIDRISEFIKKLMENQVRVDHTLMAIGGGIVQDITCFLATTLFRGMSWSFVPTTLLAQADSCIGSKSSINVGEFKNLVGSFLPPKEIILDFDFLKTLESKDILSGIGEILKVHMVKGTSEFELALDNNQLMKTDPNILHNFIEKALYLKKTLIELDEFDKGPRNVMNYGHSYGHAIESATNFEIPHGVAVTIGMDMANYQSFKMGRISELEFRRWHSVLKTNYNQFTNIPINLDLFLMALKKDKKNQGSDLGLILVHANRPIEKVRVPADTNFVQNCTHFFHEIYRS